MYESHISLASHASSLHSTARSTSVVPAECQNDDAPDMLASFNAASLIAAAAGRMLWQQAYAVDYLASSIISRFWRSRKQRCSAEKSRLAMEHLKQSSASQAVRASNFTFSYQEAICVIHAAMARAVWRQGFVIDYTAALIIGRTWKKKQKLFCFKRDSRATVLTAPNSIEACSTQALEEKACSPNDATADPPSLASREAMIAASIKSKVGQTDVLPNDIVVELLQQCGIFVSSAVETISSQLKATSPFHCPIFCELLIYVHQITNRSY